MQKICNKFGKEPEEVCFYPDKTRKKLKQGFFEKNEVEMETKDEIKILF